MRFTILITFLASVLNVSGAFSASGSIDSLLSRTTPVQKSSKATRVYITQGLVKPDPIAFSPLFASKDAQTMGTQFLRVIQKDLCGCGVFYALDPASFLQRPEEIARDEPVLKAWRLIKARFLVCGTAEASGRNTALKIRVYDINRGVRVLAFSVEVSQENWRKAAHMASDQIYSRLTGEKGMFNTRIAYIEAMPAKKQYNQNVNYLRQLRIMDQDGENIEEMTDGNHLVMSPQFSPDGKSLAYLLFKNIGKGRERHPVAHVYLMDVATKKIRPLLAQAHMEAISSANGYRPVTMTYAPRFSPDSKSVCFSLIIDGKSAIYTMNVSSGQIRRLTDHRAIDTSPAYSPDGKSIVFTSNRSGKEKIYLMDVNGSNVRRVTSGEGKYSQPVFSPRGDFIAFAKQIGNQFYIGVVRPNGSEERLIIQGYLTENPCWSPNGRYILFVWQGSSRQKQCLCKIDLTGLFMQTMAPGREIRDCAWSPLLDVH